MSISIERKGYWSAKWHFQAGKKSEESFGLHFFHTN